MNTHERLAYSTTLVKVSLKDGIGSGTGFFVNLVRQDGSKELVLVTNKHVIEGAIKINLVITLKDPHVRYPNSTQTIDMINQKWIHHPDDNIDLCCLKLSAIRKFVEQKDGVEWMIEPYEVSQIATHGDLAKYYPADETFAIGYPDGLRDNRNNQPLFRRGVLAVIPSLNFNGEEQFVVDMSIYPGSSGSPVVDIAHGLQDEGEGVFAYLQHEGEAKLLGVISKTFIHGVDGRVSVVPAATKLSAHMEIPNNLGLAIKAYKVLDFCSLI